MLRKLDGKKNNNWKQLWVVIYNRHCEIDMMLKRHSFPFLKYTVNVSLCMQNNSLYKKRKRKKPLCLDKKE